MLTLAPGLLPSLPTAEAGTACVIAPDGTARSCTFLCYNNDVIHFNWFGGSRTIDYTVEATCGGASASCDVSGYYALCEGAGRAVNGVGTCIVKEAPAAGASAATASPTAGPGGRPGPIAIARDSLPLQPDTGVVECGATGGDTTPFGCVERLDPSQPGTGDPIAQYFGNDVCTSVYWLFDQPNTRPVQEAYHFQYPGCLNSNCRLDISTNGYQVSPGDPTKPYYLLGRSPTCTSDNVCFVAEYATGHLFGWNGTSTIQCTPGTETTSHLLSPTCARNGYSVSTASTMYVHPKIVSLVVPFMAPCVTYTFEQTVSVSLMLNPAGDKYTLPPLTKTSLPIEVCNNVRLPSPQSG